MADDRDKRELKLLEDFDIAATDVDDYVGQQVGYQKLDDLTVLERKVIPLVLSSKTSDEVLVRTDVYDFNNYTVSTYTVRAGHSDAAPSSGQTRNFSQVEGKQCIRDAHRALCELHGNPPPLDELMGYIMELGKDVTVSNPLKLKVNKP